MKFKGSGLDKFNSCAFPLHRDNPEDPENPMVITLILTALPLGWDNKIPRSAFRYPTAPNKVKMDGNKVVVDKTTKKAVTYQDKDDVNYREALNEAYKRMKAVEFREMLRNDPNWDFDPYPTGKEGWEEYLDKLAEDYSSLAITNAEITDMQDALEKLNKGEKPNFTKGS